MSLSTPSVSEDVQSTPGIPDIAPVLEHRRSVTWRSLLLGTAAVILICGLTPLNDFIFSDTSPVAGYLPIGAVLVAFILVVGINAPLHRYSPRHALSTGELAVIMLMVLCACSIPNWGLMRFLIPMPVVPFRLGAADAEFWKPFAQMQLPGWLFPVESVEEGRTSTIAQWFYTRVPNDESIPFKAWIIPLAAWGVFIIAMLATLVSLARMVLDQWVANERLPFPLVQVNAALIEPPERGRSLNQLFLSPVLWIGLGIVFAIHMLTCANAYFPRNVPKIPLGYNFEGIFPDPPLFYLPTKIKTAAVSFLVLGVTYFIRSKTAFSLWSIYLAIGLFGTQQRTIGRDLPDPMLRDQHLGASIAFVLGILWIGRQHWMRIVTNAVGMGSDRTYRMSFWIATLGIIVMIGWLLVVGVKLWVAALIVLFILVSHLVVSRVLAETGLPFFRSGLAAAQVYTMLPAPALSGRDVFFASAFTVLGPLTTREGSMGFAMHGLGVTRSAGVDETRERRRIGGAIALSLVVALIVAATATLYCQYSYPTPVTPSEVPQRNYLGAEMMPLREVKLPVIDHADGRFANKPHDPIVQILIGFGVTALLEIGALRWAAWPLLPVGFVASYGNTIGNTWFSIFVGWLLKVLIVRYGGAALYQKARPLFIGAIFGECLAAATWLIINAIVVSSGGQSQSVKFLL